MSSVELADVERPYRERWAANQRARIDTAKLLATVALGFAATLVATALQVAPLRWQDLVATGLLGADLAATVLVLGLDRWREPDVDEARTVAGLLGVPLQEVLAVAEAFAADIDRRVVDVVRRTALGQLVVSVLAAATAVWTLLLP